MKTLPKMRLGKWSGWPAKRIVLCPHIKILGAVCEDGDIGEYSEEIKITCAQCGVIKFEQLIN